MGRLGGVVAHGRSGIARVIRSCAPTTTSTRVLSGWTVVDVKRDWKVIYN